MYLKKIMRILEHLYLMSIYGAEYLKFLKYYPFKQDILLDTQIYILFYSRMSVFFFFFFFFFLNPCPAE